LDGTVANKEVNIVQSGTLDHGLLAKADRTVDVRDAILGGSGGRTGTTGGNGRNFFEQALESRYEDGE
jgi:hypothetical protein